MDTKYCITKQKLNTKNPETAGATINNNRTTAAKPLRAYINFTLQTNEKLYLILEATIRTAAEENFCDLFIFGEREL